MSYPLSYLPQPPLRAGGDFALYSARGSGVESLKPETRWFQEMSCKVLPGSPTDGNLKGRT